jgi:hypothetical protein
MAQEPKSGIELTQAPGTHNLLRNEEISYEKYTSVKKKKKKMT